MSKIEIQFTLHNGEKVTSTFADHTAIVQRVAKLKESLANTPSTYTGTITLNEGHELRALEEFRALPSNAGEVIDLCVLHGYPIVKITEDGFYNLTMEAKFAKTQAYIDLIKAEVAEKKAVELQKKLDAQATLDEFTAKFARDVFAGNERWVNCYETSECYGGSEEGGWYYTCYTLVACFPLSQFQNYTPVTLADIHKGATDLVGKMGLEFDLVMLEDLPAKSVTLTRPRYE
jgi:hypothetical protein